MSNINKTVRTRQVVRVTPIMPQKVVLWFSLLRRQLTAAGITGNEEKSTAPVGCLKPERIEDIAFNPPVTGQYGKLKDELIRILAESDSERVTRLAENEVMGDRKSSQF